VQLHPAFHLVMVPCAPRLPRRRPSGSVRSRTSNSCARVHGGPGINSRVSQRRTGGDTLHTAAACRTEVRCSSLTKRTLAAHHQVCRDLVRPLESHGGGDPARYSKVIECNAATTLPIVGDGMTSMTKFGSRLMSTLEDGSSLCPRRAKSSMALSWRRTQLQQLTWAQLRVCPPAVRDPGEPSRRSPGSACIRASTFLSPDGVLAR
jgi:hypothetical protein